MICCLSFRFLSPYLFFNGCQVQTPFAESASFLMYHSYWLFCLLAMGSPRSNPALFFERRVMLSRPLPQTCFLSCQGYVAFGYLWLLVLFGFQEEDSHSECLGCLSFEMGGFNFSVGMPVFTLDRCLSFFPCFPRLDPLGTVSARDLFVFFFSYPVPHAVFVMFFPFFVF